MTELESVGERIKLAREASGISQSEMARKLDVARQTYIQLESQKSNPRFKMLGGYRGYYQQQAPNVDRRRTSRRLRAREDKKQRAKRGCCLCLP